MKWPALILAALCIAATPLSDPRLNGTTTFGIGSTINFANATVTNFPIEGGGDISADDIWNAKGDLAVGTGTDTAERLAVGANGDLLFADSTTASGLKWNGGATARGLIGAGTSNFDGVFASLSSKPTTVVGYGIDLAPAGDQVDWALSLGTSVAATQAAIYSAVDHTGTGTYTRSSTNWVRNANMGANSSPLDLTCIGVYNSTNNFHGFVVVSPRHIIMSTISPIADDATVRFEPVSGVAINRTISSHVDITSNGVHIRVAKLDSDLPGTITPAKVLTAIDYSKHLGRGVVMVDHINQKLYTGDIITAGDIYHGASSESQSEARAAFYAGVGFPDNTNQGGGFFLLLDNQLIYLGPLWEDKNIWSSVTAYHSEINAAMTTLGGGYQLTDYTKDLLPPDLPQRPTQPADGVKLYDGTHNLLLDGTLRLLKFPDGTTTAIYLNDGNEDGSLILGGTYVSAPPIKTDSFINGDVVTAINLDSYQLNASNGNAVLNWSTSTGITFEGTESQVRTNLGLAIGTDVAGLNGSVDGSLMKFGDGVKIAGAAAGNGVYTDRGTSNGKRYYNLAGSASDSSANSIVWHGINAWRIYGPISNVFYKSTDAVEFPWLVTTWVLDTDGSNPVPTSWIHANPVAATAAVDYQAPDADLTSWGLVPRAIGFDTFAETPTLANLNTLVSNDNVAGLAAANTFTAANIISTAGALSTPPLYFTGSWLTGGTGTTNFPHLLLQATGTTSSTTWSTAGTAIGVNAVTGFTGNAIDYQLAGSSRFSVNSSGAITSNSDVTLGVGRWLILRSGVRLSSSNTGLLDIDSAVTRINVSGATNSFPAIGRDLVNGFTFQSAAGTATWNDASTTASGTVANRYLFGIAAPTLTATNSSVTDTVASTVYIGGAPTASTNTTIGTPYALNVAAGLTNLAGGVKIGTGVSADGGGVKHARVTTGSISAGSTALVTITWSTAFADANYTVTASVIDSTTSSLALSVVHIESVTASAVTVRVLNNAVGSLTGTVQCIGIHD